MSRARSRCTDTRAYSFLPARVLIIAKNSLRAGMVAKRFGLLQRQYIWETADRHFNGGMKILDIWSDESKDL